MKEPWQKQYDEKKTPWNYDHFDEDIQSPFGNPLNLASTLYLVHPSYAFPMLNRFIEPTHPDHTDNFANFEQDFCLREVAGT